MITLDTLKADVAALQARLADYEAEHTLSDQILCFPEAQIKLAPGEVYAGVIYNEAGGGHHLILLPGQESEINWQAATDWAAKRDAVLPTRCELSLLHANCKTHFQPEYYWSAEKHEKDNSYAWSQDFFSGNQSYDYVDCELRACAVRRLPI
jgi:hypothetical protein